MEKTSLILELLQLMFVSSNDPKTKLNKIKLQKNQLPYLKVEKRRKRVVVIGKII